MHLFIILIESLSQHMLCALTAWGFWGWKGEKKRNQNKLETLIFLSIKTCNGTSQLFFLASFYENTDLLLFQSWWGVTAQPKKKIYNSQIWSRFNRQISQVLLHLLLKTQIETDQLQFFFHWLNITTFGSSLTTTGSFYYTTTRYIPIYLPYSTNHYTPNPPTDPPNPRHQISQPLLSSKRKPYFLPHHSRNLSIYTIHIITQFLPNIS